MRQVFWPLAGMLLTQTVASIVFLTVPLMAPELARACGVAPATVGYFSSLTFLAAMFVSAAAGPAIRRFGAVLLNQAGLALSGLGLLLVLTASLPAVALSALVIGVGYGPNTPTGSHVLARVTPPRLQGVVLSIKQSGASLGGVLAGLLVPAVVVAAGWRSALVVAMLLAVGAAAAVTPLRRRLDDDRDPRQRLGLGQSWRMVRPVLTDPTLRRLTATSFAFAALQMTVFTFFVAYLVGQGGFDLVRAGFAFSVMQVAGVAARIFWGWVCDRLGGGRMLLAGIGAGSLASVVALTLVGGSGSLPLVAGIAALTGATVSGWNGVFLAEVARVVPGAEVGAATGGILFFTYSGLVFGPALFAAALDLTGSYDAVFVAFALLAGACGAQLVFGRPGRRGAQ